MPQSGRRVAEARHVSLQASHTAPHPTSAAKNRAVHVGPVRGPAGVLQVTTASTRPRSLPHRPPSGDQRRPLQLSGRFSGSPPDLHERRETQLPPAASETGPDHRVDDVVNLLLVELAERACCVGCSGDYRVDLVVRVVFRHFAVRHCCPQLRRITGLFHAFPTQRQRTGPLVLPSSGPVRAGSTRRRRRPAGRFHPGRCAA